MLGFDALGRLAVAQLVRHFTTSVAVTEAADTTSISGVVGSAGPLAVTEAQDTASIAGSLITTGTLAATDTRDTASFVGDAIIAASFALTDVPDSPSIAGGIDTPGTFAVIDTPDNIAISGVVLDPILAVLAVSETHDAADFSGKMRTSAIVANARYVPNTLRPTIVRQFR